MTHEPEHVRRDSFAFAALLSGAYASAAVALLFLAVDALRGEVLFTPSLMGSILLLGDAPSATLPVRLDMVAYYSFIHFLLFALLGVASTKASLAMPGMRRSPVRLGSAIFLLLSGGLATLDAVWFPGLVGAAGPLAMGVANVAAAAVMAGFIHRSLPGEHENDPVEVRATAPNSVP